MTAAVRLYAAKAETDKPPAQPITPSSVTPTDVVVTVSDLIRAAGLNLWDVSMWFNRKKRLSDAMSSDDKARRIRMRRPVRESRVRAARAPE